MNDSDIAKYCDMALERGASRVKQIHPSMVVTAPWVRLKCQFGCEFYGQNYCCPPDSPAAEQTRAILDCYQRAILLHLELPAGPDRAKLFQQLNKISVDLELEMFWDGYYKAFAFLAGPCLDCKLGACGKIKDGGPCTFPRRARPSMEGCGIDVYQTARNNDLLVDTLREKTETVGRFCLILVD
jgi:predicted metal-binding protein